MNENIDLKKILKDCPKGTKLYSMVHGDVTFKEITGSEYYPIRVKVDDNDTDGLSADGKLFNGFGECILFPTKDHRDWNKFTAPWLKKERFDPKTLMPFDKVLVRDGSEYNWVCELFSNIRTEGGRFKYWCIGAGFECCIPYNEDTEHLVGTSEDAPEYYRYWEE